MIFDATTLVHTTGINWDGFLANAAAIIVIVGAFGTLVARNVKRSIADNIRDGVSEVIAREVTPKFQEIHESLEALRSTSNEHASKIARLEGIQEGKRQVVAEAILKNGN